MGCEHENQQRRYASQQYLLQQEVAQLTLEDGRSRKYSVTTAMFSGKGSPQGGPWPTVGPAPSMIMMCLHTKDRCGAD